MPRSSIQLFSSVSHRDLLIDTVTFCFPNGVFILIVGPDSHSPKFVVRRFEVVAHCAPSGRRFQLLHDIIRRPRFSAARDFCESGAAPLLLGLYSDILIVLYLCREEAHTLVAGTDGAEVAMSRESSLKTVEGARV